MYKEYVDMLISRCGIKKIAISTTLGFCAFALVTSVSLVTLPDEPNLVEEKENN